MAVAVSIDSFVDVLGGDVGGRYNRGRAVVASTASNMAKKMTMATNSVIEAASIQAAVDVPVWDVAAAANELHLEMVQHLKMQLAGMEPLFHGTFLSILKIYLSACFQP